MAKLTLASPRVEVDPDGAAVVEATVKQGATRLGLLRVTFTEGRQLFVLWENASGQPPLAAFEAWSREG